MRHHYAVTIADQTPRAEGAKTATDLGFSFESHDDLNQIVERARGKALFGNEDETKAFCVGLKVLGGVLLQHRDEALFKEFAGAFGAFMKTLKAH
jgi:hypothetical protein